VPNCKPFLVAGAERKHVRQRAQFQQHGDVSCHKVFFFFFFSQEYTKGNLFLFCKKIRGTRNNLFHRKKWVTQFKHGDFSTCDAPCPGRHKTVTTPQILDQIHQLNLVDRQILAKSIDEQLNISREQVGSLLP